MSAVKDSYLDLERHRQTLEANVVKLQKAAQHWKKWRQEYEYLRVDLEELPKPASREDLARIRRDFDGELVDKKEVNEIFGRTDLRPPEQIINVLSRRIDYVERNVETLDKQLEAAEKKLAAVMVVSQPGATNEDGEAITDVIEYLDDDDNVISSRLQTPGDTRHQVQETLRKAGLADLAKQLDDAVTSSGTQGEAAPSSSRESKSEPPTDAGENTTTEKSPSAKKSVSFAEDVKADGDDVQSSRNAKRIQEIMKEAREQEAISLEDAVIPEDESPEDAQLRREMLKYGLSEVGAVVAELQLEDGSWSEDDDESFEDEEDASEEDEEDEYGASKYSVLTPEYRKKMEELEKRLGIKSTRELAEEARKSQVDDDESGPVDEGIGRIKIVPDSESNKSRNVPAAPSQETKDHSDTGRDKGKKSVKFASSLDIAEDATPAQPVSKPPAPEMDAIRADVVERSGGTATNPVEKPTRKPSRFKEERSTGSGLAFSGPVRGPLDAPARFLDQDINVAPTGPEGTTVSDSVVEKDVVSEPKDPDELDAALLQQELATEYHLQRTRRIQKQGGFMKDEQNPIQPLEEESPRRVSRFKAARLAKQ